MNFNKIQRDNSRGTRDNFPLKMYTFIRWTSIIFREIIVGVQTLHNFGEIQGHNFSKHIIAGWNCSGQVHTFSQFLGERTILLSQICSVYQHFAKILIHPVLIVIVKDKKICKNS